jgi:hypothetical protein
MESDTFRNQVAAIAAVTLNATATELVISSQQKGHHPMRRSFAFAAVAVVAAVCSMAQVRPDVPVAAADEEQAIRSFLARFYEGWNAHDVDKMVSIYADDIDHINVFGEWHKGKAEIRRDLTFVHRCWSQQPEKASHRKDPLADAGCGRRAGIDDSSVDSEPGRTDAGDIRPREAERRVDGGQLHQRRTAPSARPEVTDGGNADAIEWLFGAMLAVTHENPQRPAGWRSERAGRSTCEHWAS